MKTLDELNALARKVFDVVKRRDNRDFRHAVYVFEDIYPELRDSIYWRYLVQRDIELRLVAK